MPGHAQPKTKFDEYMDLLFDPGFEPDEFTIRRIEAECRQFLTHPDLGTKANEALAYVLAILGKDEEALAHFREVAERSPTVETLVNYAVSLSRNQKHVEALELFRTLVDQRPEIFDPKGERANSRMIGSLVRAFGRAGHREFAFELLEAAFLGLNPHDVRAHMEYANAALGIGDDASAAVLTARWHVLMGHEQWPEGGARELLQLRPDLWKGSRFEEAVARYLGLGRPLITLADVDDTETADIASALEVLEAFQPFRLRAWEEVTNGG